MDPAKDMSFLPLDGTWLSCVGQFAWPSVFFRFCCCYVKKGAPAKKHATTKGETMGDPPPNVVIPILGAIMFCCGKR